MTPGSIAVCSHGGATITGPDATPPPAICQNLGGGGCRAVGGGWLEGVGGGGRLEGLGGGRPEGVGGGGFGRWGGLRTTHYYHMHTFKGDVCLGRVWGSCWWLL